MGGISARARPTGPGVLGGLGGVTIVTAPSVEGPVRY